MRAGACALALGAAARLVDARPLAAQEPLVLRPAAVFDGAELHTGWSVRVEGGHIAAAGPSVPMQGARVIELAGATLLPGMIEGHSHLLLHPYDETPWADQVLYEPLAERVARGVVHARLTLEAGFTTVRDLGTEGAGYADVGLRSAIGKGVVPGRASSPPRAPSWPPARTSRAARRSGTCRWEPKR